MLVESQLSNIIKNISENYKNEDLFYLEEDHQMPNRDAIIHIIMGLREIMFPGYFDKEQLGHTIPEYYLGHNIIKLYETLSEQIRFALQHSSKNNTSEEETDRRTDEICQQFLSSFSTIQKQLLKDVQKQRKKLFFAIQDYLPFLSIEWHMNYIN